MRFLNLYQYLGPLLLTPLAWWLWRDALDGDGSAAVAITALPILFAYVIPGLGTNWLHLWEFNTRLRLGRFRPHHGFVFGSATAVFAAVVLAPLPAEPNAGAVIRAGFVLGSVLAFWNWLYDIYAIEKGFLVVFNRPFAAGAGGAAIATDYAPAIFGAFGLVYGAEIPLLAWWSKQGALLPATALAALPLLVVPPLAFMAVNRVRYGDWGLARHGHD